MTFDSFLQTVSSKTAPISGASVIEAQSHSLGAGGLYFTVDAWDGGKHVFGPAPWPTGSAEPPTGTNLIVMFLGSSIEQPRVIGYAHGGSVETDLAAHIIDPTPHPAYDDMADLTLIYENGLV